MCSKQRSFCKLQQPSSVCHRSFQELQGSISWVSPCRPSVWHETHISSAQQQQHTNERRAEDGIVNTQYFTNSTKNARLGKYDLAMQRLPVPHSVLSYQIAHYDLSLEQNKNKHILLFFSFFFFFCFLVVAQAANLNYTSHKKTPQNGVVVVVLSFSCVPSEMEK